MTSNGATRQVDQIIWRKDLYPRFEPDPATIQRYAESLDRLPPIWINQRDELIDGYHRWTAHRKEGAPDISVIVKETQSDAALLRMAVETNATHGLQLSPTEKRSLALKLYDAKQKRGKADLAQLLSVSEEIIRRWVEDKDRAEEEEQRERIFSLWMRCATQEEIASEVGLSQPQVAERIKKLSEIQNFGKPIILSAEFRETEWTPPLYNIWNFAKNTNTATHFGNSAQEIVDRLLYLYTEPFEIVVDSFAGGGSTIDVCKRRLRRYWVSDRLPIPERQDVREADIADGPPPLHKRWSDVALMYLDPPYWRQARGQYSEDPGDLANMSLEDFYAALARYVKSCGEKMRSGSHIALLIQPTQWLADERETVDHVVDLIRLISSSRLVYRDRIICPYQTEQYNPQQATWAKEHRRLLTLNRELIVWRVVP